MKQGGAAAAATFAMTAVTAFRLGHEKGLILSPGSVVKFSTIVAGLAGVAWSAMPKAKEPPGQTIEEAKEQLYPAVKVAVNRLIKNEELFQDSIESESDPQGRSTYTSDSERQRSIARANRRYGRMTSNTGFDDDFDMDSPSEDDFVTDEEFEDILMEEMLTDPFYDGPGSVFDKM